ncbi:MAG: hypothetical protein SGI89_14135 [bacterium]|nr:hypothetical protein [bacterium]
MKILQKNSLAKTIENLNEAFLTDVKLSLKERKEVAGWIAGRQGLKGSYANMFAPSATDFNGIILFTGDNITSKASIAHIIGEESLWALYILDVKDKTVSKKLSEAGLGIKKAIQGNDKLRNSAKGTFCCGKCSVAYWRNLSGEGVAENKTELENGIKFLKAQRDGKGGWRRFPFYYTLLALTGIDIPSAKDEMRYASAVCERYVKRKSSEDKYTRRKKEIAKKVLSLI